MTAQPAPTADGWLPVDPGGIEKARQGLWRSRGEASLRAAPDDKPQGRTIWHSLLVYAPDAAMDDPHFQAVISDLSWARLAAWRYQTAQIFDAANLRPYLKRIQRARLSYYVGSPVLAWLFGGWLASRLGWKCVERDALGARY